MLPDHRPETARDRLDSWKDIAAYLRRDVSTVQRWEKREGLPVHRHHHDKQGSVYAFKSELDAWWSKGSHAADTAEPRGARQPRRRVVPYSIAALLTAALAGSVWWVAARSEPAPLDVVRSTIPLPPEALNAFPVISNDGLSVVYTGVPRGGTLGPLYVKAVNELHGRAISGTEGAQQPFFSPDGNWIGYFADRKLFKVTTRGGVPIELATTPSHRGGAWLADDTIVFTRNHLGGLFRVSAAGGSVSAVTTPDRTKLERTHRWPYAVPGVDAVLFTVQRASAASYDDADIEAVRVSTGKRSIVVRGGTNPIVAESGHLLYLRGDRVWAAPFDMATLQVTGEAIAVIDGVLHRRDTGRMSVTVSRGGTLIYAAGGDLAATQLMWADRSGRLTPAFDGRGTFSLPRVSPNGRYVSVSIDEGVPRIAVLDLKRGTLIHRTHGWDAEVAFWSPDSDQLGIRQYAFTPDGRHTNRLALLHRDGSDEGRILLESDVLLQAYDWSPDGSRIAVSRQGDIGFVDVSKPRGLTPFVGGPEQVALPRFSPDGRWLLYSSNKSGRFQVHVKELADARREWQVSTEGGMLPVWSREGNEIYYVQPQPVLMMTVKVDRGPDFSAGRPEALFEPPPGIYEFFFDVAPDGRFLLVSRQPEIWRTNGLVMVQNWFEELRSTVSAR